MQDLRRSLTRALTDSFTMLKALTSVNAMRIERFKSWDLMYELAG